jgi:hypothetical protein
VVAGILPHTLTRWLLHDIAKTISVNFTNVPGPRGGISILGKKCDYFYFAANGAGKCAITFGCFTYNNTIVYTATVDKAVADDAGEVLSLFAEEANNFS